MYGSILCNLIRFSCIPNLFLKLCKCFEELRQFPIFKEFSILCGRQDSDACDNAYALGPHGVIMIQSLYADSMYWKAMRGWHQREELRKLFRGGDLEPVIAPWPNQLQSLWGGNLQIFGACPVFMSLLLMEFSSWYAPTFRSHVCVCNNTKKLLWSHFFFFSF